MKFETETTERKAQSTIKACPVPNCGGQVIKGHEVCPNCEAVIDGFKSYIGRSVFGTVLEIESLRELFFLGRNFLGLTTRWIGDKKCSDGYQSICYNLGVTNVESIFEGKQSLLEFCKRYEKEPFDRISILKMVLFKASYTKPGEYPILDTALTGYTRPRAELLNSATPFPFRRNMRPHSLDGVVMFDDTEADVAQAAPQSKMEQIKNALNKAFTLKALSAGHDMAKLWNTALESGFANWIKGEFRRIARSRRGHREYAYLPQIESLEKIEITEESLDRLKQHFSK